MRSTICALLLLLLTTCTTVKRYASMEGTIPETPFPFSDTSKAAADASTFKVFMNLSDYRIEPDDAKPSFKTLWELQGQGQKELVSDLNHRYTDPDKFAGSLNNKYLKSDDKIEPVLDLTKRHVKFVFTIQRRRFYDQLGHGGDDFSVADRIEYIRYWLTLDDSSFYFENWNKYSTEYANINIADVSYQQSLSVTASAGDSAVAGVSASGSASKTENQHIQYRYVQLNGTLQRNKLEFESEGTRETDLSGNVVAEVNMKFKARPYATFVFPDFGEEDSLKKPQKVDLVTVIAKVPIATGNKTITGRLTYVYSYRHVMKKAKTIYEWDDKIRYYTGKVVKKVSILLPEDILPNFYGIMPENTSIDNDNLRIKIVDSSQARGFKITNLVFQDPGSASDFINWLTKYPVSKGEDSSPIRFKNHMLLYWNAHPLTRHVVDSLKHADKGMLAFRYFPAPSDNAAEAGGEDKP